MALRPYLANYFSSRRLLQRKAGTLTPELWLCMALG
jgi:hypothetical protein